MRLTSEETQKLRDLEARSYDAYQEHLEVKLRLIDARSKLKDREAELVLQGTEGPITGRNDRTRESQLRHHTQELIAKVRELEGETRAAWIEATRHWAHFVIALGHDTGVLPSADDEIRTA